MTIRRSLAPGLLLAAPRLGDPNFERTVVLLARHDDNGALGWVVNGKELAPVGELLQGTSLVPEGVTLPLDGAFARPARVGGPVSPQTGWILYRRDAGALAGEIDAGDELAVTGDADALAEVIREATRPFRLFLGYAGWGPGQLEGEVKAGVWLPADVDAALVFDAEPADLWDAAYRETIGAAPATFISTRGGSA
ncbi:MAG: YqgE/AlgH family protein [Polyangiales bacterium]